MFTIPETVTAISFDIWKTLLRGTKAFTQIRLRTIFEELGLGFVLEIDKVDEILLAAYREADRFYNDESERTMLDYGMAERLEMMYSILGILKPGIPDAVTISAIQVKVGELRSQPQYLPTLTEPDLIETLQALRDRGFVLGLLSNTGMDNQQVMRAVLTEMGMWDLFQVHIFSSDDGRAKPNPGLFQRMAVDLGVEPSRVLHVGDNHNADCRGAVEAGLEAVLYSPKGNPKGRPYAFIRSMKELLG